MQRLLLYFIILSMASILNGQKYDYQWPMGYKGNFGVGDLSLLDFSGDTVKVYKYATLVFELQLHNGSSFICDEDGELLLMTNNCGIYSANLELVPGTYPMTPGITSNNFCEEYGEYPAYQSTIILPEMGNDSVFYVVHKDSELNDSLQTAVSYNLYLSTLCRQTDGTFQLVEKRLLINSYMNVNRLTACLNGAGDKWWLWTIEYNTNRFFKFLIGGQDTVNGPFVQEIGDALINEELSLGQAAYSPNAGLMAINSNKHELILYDFDNITGELSNFRSIPYPDTAGSARGLAFSPDSKLAYLSTSRNLYQVDIETETVMHIALHTSVDEDGWPIGMGFMYLGPDCRLYISPGSATYYMHVIHHPNEKDIACGFQPRALRAPNAIRHHFPNLPMYRFGGACDSTIQFPFVDTVNVAAEMEIKRTVKVFPNPVQGEINVSVAKLFAGGATFRLSDSLGRLCMERPLQAGLNTFPAQGLGPGLYFYEVRAEGRQWQGGKLVKLER